jgi:hypothetical protein
MKFLPGKCNTLSGKTSHCHVKYEKALKNQSIQQKYIGIITPTGIACYTRINNTIS